MQEQRARRVGKREKEAWKRRRTQAGRDADLDPSSPKPACLFYHIPELESDSQPGSPMFVAVIPQKVFRQNPFRHLRTFENDVMVPMIQQLFGHFI